MYRKLLLASIGIVCVAAPLAATAQSSDTSTRIAALRTQLATLQSQMGHMSTATTPTPPSTTLACTPFSRTLSLGAHGSDVSNLQNILISKGFLQGTSATGYYGKMTAQAVGKFQVSKGLVSSSASQGYGSFGPRTRASMSCTNGGSTSGGSTGGMDRIAVRQGSNGAELYDTVTNQPFTPRGNNYENVTFTSSRLTLQCSPYWGFSTFAVKTEGSCDGEYYDSAAAESALERMHAEGYNVVRSNIASTEIGATSGGGLDTVYLANVADFMTRAKANGIYVIFTTIGVPNLGGYQSKIEDSKSFGAQVNAIQDNSIILSPEGVAAKQQYMSDLIAGLRAAGAPMDDILAIDVENEIHYDTSKQPFSLSSGSVTTANGKMYDMSDASSVNHMKDDGVIYYVNQVQSSVHAALPGVLVEASAWPQYWTPSSSDPRESRTKALIANPQNGGSMLDLVDIHIYTFMNATVSQLTSDLGVSLSDTTKPVIVGEFGATTPVALVDAPATLKGMAQDICNAGYKGELLFTWNSDTKITGLIYWSALAGDGAINQTIAPIYLPSLCASQVPPPVSATIQGQKVLMPNNDTSNTTIAGQKVSVEGQSSTSDNPYAITVNAGSTYQVSVPPFPGYSVGYTLCVDNKDCHTGTPTTGLSASVTIPSGAGHFADLWWHYTPYTLPPLTGGVTTHGYLDAVSCALVAGWAQDTSDPSTAINVDFYVDTPPTNGDTSGFAGRILADNNRPELCGPLGSCNHEFSFAVPAKYRDGKTHTLYAYGVDTDGNAADNQPLTPSAGITETGVNPQFQCGR